jgi:drug/metabolite transporter (DMT)-like permease
MPKAAGDAPALVMQLVLAIFAAPLLVAAAVGLHATGIEQFQAGRPSPEVVLKCLTVAFTATVGHLLIYSATVRASAALVSPTTYVQLLVAAALGWLWFGDAPDAASFGGAGLIIAGGFWLWRSQKPVQVPEPPD